MVPTKRVTTTRGPGQYWSAVKDVWLAAIHLVQPAVDRDASSELRATAIALLTIILGLFICLAVLFFGKPENNPWAGGITILLVLLGFAYAGLILFRGEPHVPVATFRPWCRKVVRWPLSDEHAAALGILLADVRQQAISYFKLRRVAISDELVRANIFLPDYSSHQDGKTLYVLRCPSALTRAMGKADANMRLLPGEGLSGAVFITGETRITTNRFDGLWTEETKCLVTRNLKWIVSQPLKGSRQVTLGVLNIDGIDLEISEEHLSGLAAFVADGVSKVASFLERAPLCELSVSVNDVKP